MISPLLSIAIPTWNRAELLKDGLTTLLAQIKEEDKDKIEIVISDNASTDGTNQIIEAYMAKYSYLNIVHYRQKENTGYFGNFKKCRELSNGQYFWLLSDNDHIAGNLISFILNILQKKTPSFVFLSDWKLSQKVSNGSFLEKEYQVEDAFIAFNYKTTLISSVIFLNNKSEDPLLFEQFRGNTFIGFMYFLQSLDFNKKAIEINGSSLFIKNTKVSFNAFKSFSDDLTSCIEYAISKTILTHELGNIFINKVISELVVRQYIMYRITGKLHGMNPGRKDEIDVILHKGFNAYEAYKKELSPLQNAKGLGFYRLALTKHFLRILRQRMK